MISKRRTLTILFSLLTLTVLLSGFALGAEPFTYQPYDGTLHYNLTIQSHALLYISSPGGYGRVFRDHEDILRLSQRIEETGEGLLDIATTVEEINLLPPARGADPPGMVYKRKDIVGNTQHIKVNRSGKVEEARVIPQMASRFFWNNGEDGPPLDFYNVLILLNPRFPSDLPEPGDSWETEEEIELEMADALPIAGLMELDYELEMTVHQKIQYTLLDFVEKKGYRCAHIRFEAQFTTSGGRYTPSHGSYLEGNGESSGELCFAPKEGILVSASMTHNASEKKSEDGLIRRFITPREMVWLEAFDQTTVPLPWRSERIVSLELVENQ